jgi:membrane protein DedA with SNARE-associated domain
LSVLLYILGGFLGLAYGTAIAYINGRLTENYIRNNKDHENPMQRANGFSATRQIINAGALVVLFLFYGILKKMFLPVLIGALIGIGFVSYVFLFRIGKKTQDDE